MSVNIRIAVDVKLFQHLKEVVELGSSLSEKTGIYLALLQRLTRHLVAMYLITYHDGAFHATTLSNSLAEENCQHSKSFCYDAARPSFNGFPGFFKGNSIPNPFVREPRLPLSRRAQDSAPVL